ncbi:hypothetical protein GSI_01620 [Ganoderma sinense ZZ0214-1]|uniref:gluconokinase n=1 Tax=Ganoderma sinense ZZ0214-1 TaxID=1077348 RepID=A0A2G8SQC6_9APHY|nr:hypothetical protein GSI_01620 [Ganoderma sinense ZZ0214-1]
MSHEHDHTPGVPDATKSKRNPILIVVMGVAGTGKTTLALALQARLGMPYIEGDALHPPENIAKMSAGTPLTDTDREPWLKLIRTTAERLVFPPSPSHSDPDRQYPDAPGVLATCSALRGYYRDILRGTHVPPGLPVDMNGNGDDGSGTANGNGNGNEARGGSLPAYFVYIKGERAVIWERISAREGHYMKPGMLDSQIAALESPEGEEGVVVVPLEASTEQQADIAIRELNKLLPEPLEPLFKA